MDSEGRSFGRGSRELTGSVDLISHYKLLPHHKFFSKESLALSISDTHYLHHLVGDTSIRKGEGLQLHQLIENQYYQWNRNAGIHPFDLDILRDAFHLRETSPFELPSEEKGTSTIAGKCRGESRDKGKKHKKHKDRENKKYEEHKKHKRHHEDDNKGDERKDKSADQDLSTEHFKKHHQKKRKRGGDEDTNEIHKHRKSKHKSSRIEEMGTMKILG